MAAKEDSAPQAETQETPFKEVLEYALKSACAQEGGLELPLSLRANRPVKETMYFGPDTNVDVEVNSMNFDFTLIIDGVRYHTAERSHAPVVIRKALDFASSGGGEFHFPDLVSFRTSSLASAQAMAA